MIVGTLYENEKTKYSTPTTTVRNRLRDKSFPFRQHARVNTYKRRDDIGLAQSRRALLMAVDGGGTGEPRLISQRIRSIRNRAISDSSDLKFKNT